MNQIFDLCLHLRGNALVLGLLLVAVLEVVVALRLVGVVDGEALEEDVVRVLHS